MIDEIRSLILRLWPWGWATAEGDVTAVGFHRSRRIDTADEVELVVTYKFSIGGDGPYTGLRRWTSTHYLISDIVGARQEYREGGNVTVQYRKNNPMVNKLKVNHWRLR